MQSPTIYQRPFDSVILTPNKAIAKPKLGSNYASFDCGAQVLETNKDATSASAILVRNKDQYMLSPCDSEKYVVIELCQEVLLESVAMANLELYSSTFKGFRLLATKKNDWKINQGWTDLGMFTAQNSRSMQTFELKKPYVWTKYLKIVIDSHYGNQFYCPITSVQAFGQTMFDEIDSDPDIPNSIKNMLNGTIEAPKEQVTPTIGPIEPKPNQESVLKTILKRLNFLEATVHPEIVLQQRQDTVRLYQDLMVNVSMKWENLFTKIVHESKTRKKYKLTS
jgi:hypothetical protein